MLREIEEFLHAVQAAWLIFVIFYKNLGARNIRGILET